MRKLIIGIAAVAMLAACGGDNNDNNDNHDANGSTNSATNNGGTNNGGTNNGTPNNGGTNNGTPNNGGTNNGGTNNGTPNNGGGAQFCQLECATAADCTPDGGNEADWECNADRCEYVGATADGCGGDDEACVAQFSGWVTDCTSDADCPGQVCVSDDGGKCASEPSEALPCDMLQMEEYETTKAEDDSAVTVCAQPRAVCNDQDYCHVPCTDNAECDAQTAGFVCNMDTGFCECDSDEACSAIPGSDTCYDGACGCSEEATCDDLETGDATYACDSF